MSDRLLIHIPWLAVSALSLFGALFSNVALAWGPWLLLGSALLLGLPHGSCDVWVPGWRQGHAWTISGLSLLTLGYLALCVLVYTHWATHPPSALGFFLVLTALHWGTGDSIIWSRNWRAHVCLGLARGSFVMLIPIMFWRDQVATELSMALPEAAPPVLEFIDWTGGFLLAGALLLCAVGLSTMSIRDQVHHLLETILIVILLLLTPPYWSVGVYFIFVHSWRHIVRLGALASQDNSMQAVSSLKRVYWAGAPFSIAGLVLLFMLAWLRWPSDAALPGIIGAYLVLLACLTLPHAIIVIWLDVDQLRRTKPGHVPPESGTLPALHSAL